MTQKITKSDLGNALAWFDNAIAAAHPNWVQEARYILRLRAKGYGYGKCAKILARLGLPNRERPYSRHTVKNRLLWALDVWRANT